MTDTEYKNMGLMYRMYVLLEKHLSPIDKGIQASHSIVEYANKYANNQEYKDWAFRDKTIVFLNGGTVQDLDDITNILKTNDINHAFFKEPDLGNMITAVSFLVNSQIYNSESLNDYTCDLMASEQGKLFENGQEEFIKYVQDKWIKKVGGYKNKLIYDLIKTKHLTK